MSPKILYSNLKCVYNIYEKRFVVWCYFDWNFKKLRHNIFLTNDQGNESVLEGRFTRSVKLFGKSDFVL